MIRILFTHYGDDHIRGSERCLLDLVRHLDRERFSAVVWCNSPSLETEAKALGVPVYRSRFPILFGWLPCRHDFRGFLGVVREGLRIVDDEKIDLIHANSGAPNQWLNIVARMRKLPLVSHLHSRYPLRDRLTLGLHNSSQVVGVSQPIVDQLLDDGIDPARVQVVPNGIDTELQDRARPVDLRRLLNLEQQDFVAITVASLIHRKGIDLLIRAIARLRKRGVPMQLVVAGDGPDKALLQELASDLQIEHCVHFLGSRDDVAGLLRGGADLFVSGAREEVFGLALAEANLASIPVVAPEVGGIPGVIEDNVSGLLVAPENSISLAGAIDCLYRNPQLKNNLGRAGRDRVLRNFRIETNVSRLQQIYLNLLQDKSRRLDFFTNASLGSMLRMLKQGARVYLRNLKTADHIGSGPDAQQPGMGRP